LKVLLRACRQGGVWADFLSYLAGDAGAFHFDKWTLLHPPTGAWIRLAINLYGGRGMDFTDGVNVFHFARAELEALLLLPSAIAQDCALLPHRGAAGSHPGLQLILTFVKLHEDETIDELMERVRAIGITLTHLGVNVTVTEYKRNGCAEPRLLTSRGRDQASADCARVPVCRRAQVSVTCGR
jgi:hypothetical protein